MCIADQERWGILSALVFTIREDLKQTDADIKTTLAELGAVAA